MKDSFGGQGPGLWGCNSHSVRMLPSPQRSLGAALRGAHGVCPGAGPGLEGQDPAAVALSCQGWGLAAEGPSAAENSCPGVVPVSQCQEWM